MMEKKVIINSGYQNKYGLPVTEDSLFQIGSISKSFLSVVVLQLEAENKLNIENTVEDFFPNRYPKWNKITIKKLLNMTSGIFDYFNDDNKLLNEIGKNPYKYYSTDDLLDLVKEKELWFNPGSNWKYSNTNYVILGKIVEKVTHQTIAHEIHKRIIKPLKLSYTYYLINFPKIDIPSSQEKNMMDGYYFNDEQNQFPPYLVNGKGVINYSISITNAAGSITSNVKDLNKYLHALFKQDYNGNSKLLAKAQFEELVSLVDLANGKPLTHRVNKENTNGYGLGIFASYDSSTNLRFYSHSGQTLGFNSYWSFNPEKNSSVVLSLNSSGFSNNFNEEINKPLSSFLNINCF